MPSVIRRTVGPGNRAFFVWWPFLAMSIDGSAKIGRLWTQVPEYYFYVVATATAQVPKNTHSNEILCRREFQLWALVL